LLAKQGWRLLHNPYSLAGCILKAKYFPRGSFLNASLGSRPSYAWRSIFSAKDLLTEDLVWRIVNGFYVKIWGDKWLPTQSSFAVQSPRKVLTENATVSELIDPNTKWWNTQLIVEIFISKEENIIVGLPLSQYGRKYLLI
jgi:hypothetical protein